MMNNDINLFNRIFVVLEPQQQEQLALKRAVYLAKATGAALHLYVCVYDMAIGIATFLSGAQRDNIIRTVVDGNKVMVAKLVNDLSKDGIEVTTDVVWSRHPGEAITNAVRIADCDLLIKKAKMHSRLQEVIFSHLDWNILRVTQCPVLLVKKGQWDKVGQVLAAVNAAPEDEVHADLNIKILEASRSLATKLNFELHLVSAYPAPPAYLPISSDGKDPVNYRKKMSNMVSENVSKFAAQFAVNEDHVHLLEGPVDWVIPKVSRNIYAEFVVMGTVARQRMGGVALGNTAEHILDELNCDVLVLKSGNDQTATG